MVDNFGHNLDGQWQALTHGILVQLEIFDLLLCEYIHRMSNSSIIFIASNYACLFETHVMKSPAISQL